MRYINSRKSKRICSKINGYDIYLNDWSLRLNWHSPGLFCECIPKSSGFKKPLVLTKDDINEILEQLPDIEFE